MTVYCVCPYNIYEGTYAPRAVFSTEEKAEEYIRQITQRLGNDGQNGHAIEEFEVDGFPCATALPDPDQA